MKAPPAVRLAGGRCRNQLQAGEKCAIGASQTPHQSRRPQISIKTAGNRRPARMARQSSCVPGSYPTSTGSLVRRNRSSTTPRGLVSTGSMASVSPVNSARYAIETGLTGLETPRRPRQPIGWRAGVARISGNRDRADQKRPNGASAASQTAKTSQFTSVATRTRRSSPVARENRCVPGSHRPRFLSESASRRRKVRDRRRSDTASASKTPDQHKDGRKPAASTAGSGKFVCPRFLAHDSVPQGLATPYRVEELPLQGSAS